jgi:hypothetical protein
MALDYSSKAAIKKAMKIKRAMLLHAIIPLPIFLNTMMHPSRQGNE